MELCTIVSWSARRGRKRQCIHRQLASAARVALISRNADGMRACGRRWSQSLGSGRRRGRSLVAVRRPDGSRRLRHRPLTSGDGGAPRGIRTPNRQIRSLVISVDLVGSRRIWAAHVGCFVDPGGSRRLPLDRLDDQTDDQAREEAQAAVSLAPSGPATSWRGSLAHLIEDQLEDQPRASTTSHLPQPRPDDVKRHLGRSCCACITAPSRSQQQRREDPCWRGAQLDAAASSTSSCTTNDSLRPLDSGGTAQWPMVDRAATAG
jgi:hypothetical protein